MKITTYDNTTLDQIIEREGNISFSTRKDGANCYYHIANFSLAATIAESWNWLVKKNGFVLKIEDNNQLLWEGELEDFCITLEKLLVTAYGGTDYLYVPVSVMNAANWYISVRDLNELWLKHRASASETRITVGAWVYDVNGIRYPSSWIKAGEVIRIRDLVPATTMLIDYAADGLRTFTILETNYNAMSATNELIFDTDNPTLDAILARAAL